MTRSSISTAGGVGRRDKPISLPVFTTLPPCTAARRNQMGMLKGANGVADRCYVCEKTAADTYAWASCDAAGGGGGGATGPQGATGPTGPQGAAGSNGSQGPQGTAGSAGAQGPTGAQGVAGSGSSDWKDSVRVASTGNLNLAVTLHSVTVDGVTLTAGDRVLVKNQTTASENGIWLVGVLGAPARTSDANTSALVTPGATVYVEEGTANGQSVWTLTNTGTVTLGTTALTFSKIVGATGPTGPQGVKGDTGASGPQGTAGSAGSQGPQGVKGDTGTAGAQGAAGSAGSQGPQGVAGSAGAQGPTGPQGAAGSQGPQGPTGAASTVTGPTGPQGAAGSQGPQGAAGAAGAQGYQGVTGAQGTYGGAWTFPFAFDTSTTDADPASGGLRLDNSTPGNATKVFAHKNDANAKYVGDALEAVCTVGGIVRVVSTSDPTNWVAGVATPGGGLDSNHYDINVPLDGTGTFGNGDPVLLCLDLSGSEGPQGATGPQGPQGPQGAAGAAGSQGPQGAAGAGDVTGPASSVDGEIALFSGTTGKTLKRASLSGLVKAASGVASAAVAGTDYCPATSGSGLLKGNGSGGTTGLTPYVATATTSISNGSGGSVTASCQTGEVMLSGGCGFDGTVTNNQYVKVSAPNATSGDTLSWYCEGWNAKGSGSATFRARVRCLS